MREGGRDKIKMRGEGERTAQRERGDKSESENQWRRNVRKKEREGRRLRVYSANVSERDRQDPSTPMEETCMRLVQNT